MKKKIIPLDLAFEFLNETKNEPEDKKKAAAERKQMRELRERHPIKIAISFKIPWWCSTEDVV